MKRLHIVCTDDMLMGYHEMYIADAEDMDLATFKTHTDNITYWFQSYSRGPKTIMAKDFCTPFRRDVYHVLKDGSYYSVDPSSFVVDRGAQRGNMTKEEADRYKKEMFDKIKTYGIYGSNCCSVPPIEI